MEEDIQTKQQYLRREIMDEGYDPGDFNTFMCSIRNEEDIDLDTWTLEDLRNVVESFKEEVMKKQQEEQENLQIEDNNNNTYSFKPSPTIQSRETVNSIKVQLDGQNNDPFDEYHKVEACIRLSKNEITYRNDLFITICNPVKINPGFFSLSYYQYEVKTYPLNYDVLRKVSDFIFLNQKLPLIHPLVYTPSIPSFQYGLKDDSPKKMRYLQNYMNLLIENKFFRSLPIVYDFITLPQEDWNQKVKKKYSKISIAMKFENMPNFEGKNTIAISKSEEAKASKIKTEITPISAALLNLNSHLDELLAAIDKVSLCFKNVGLSFEELQKKSMYFNDTLSSGYKHLAELFKTWSNNYKTQSEFFREEIKYHFKFMEKEYTTFLKNFEDYRLAREEYKRTFDRMKKNKAPTKEDLYSLKDIKKYYAYQLVYINNEYYLLKERQANRLVRQFIKYYDNKDVIFQDYQKCISLINFQKHYDMAMNKYKGMEDYEINLENENNNENINDNNIEENNNYNSYNSYEQNNNENEINTNNIEEDIKKEEIKSDINDTNGNDEQNKEDNNINKDNNNEIITDNGNKMESEIKTDNVDTKEKEENKLGNSEKEKVNENKSENKDEKKENAPNNIEESKPVDNNIKKEEEKKEEDKKEEIKVEEKKEEIKKEEEKKVEEKKEENKIEEEKKGENKIEEDKKEETKKEEDKKEETKIEEEKKEEEKKEEEKKEEEKKEEEKKEEEKKEDKKEEEKKKEDKKEEEEKKYNNEIYFFRSNL